MSFRLAGRGGIETVLRNVIDGLNQRGIDARLCLIGGTADERWVQHLPYEEIVSIEGNKYKKHIGYMIGLMKVIVRNKPDIIIGLERLLILYCQIIKRMLLLDTQVGTWMHLSLDQVRTKSLEQADFHLAISSGIKEQFTERNIAKNDNVYLIYNPIERTSVTVSRGPGRCTEFLYVGRLQFNRHKRVSDLLNACSQLTGCWRLTVIGNGKEGEDDERDLVGLARELGINDRIAWLGWKESPWDHVDSASTLVLTSDSEGFAMVLGEAMARGIPCISSDCMGPRDIIKPGINGWLYPPRDIDRLRSILQDVISGDVRLPSPCNVKASISNLYSEEYFDNLVGVFDKLVTR